MTIYKILSPITEIRLKGSLLLFLFAFKFLFKKIKVDAFSQPSGSFPIYHEFLKVANNDTETASDYFFGILCNKSKTQSGGLC